MASDGSGSRGIGVLEKWNGGMMYWEAAPSHGMERIEVHKRWCLYVISPAGRNARKLATPNAFGAALPGCAIIYVIVSNNGGGGKSKESLTL